MYAMRFKTPWKVPTEYGDLDIAINLSNSEKDPEAVATVRDLPTRQNHRVVPVTINGSPWFLQYIPHVCYNEHCICFGKEHSPMKIDRACFAILLGFVRQFPYYFAGANADLSMVGGAELAYEHFQGGRYTFALERAPIEMHCSFPGFRDVEMGIVKWPMSVIRMTADDPARLVELADKVMIAWRGYTDESAFIFAKTDGGPHNTITPIARRRGEKFELDLMLRNNITTEEHPLGVYHPHAELHHIKKDNIGLTEAMGLAVLPARLKEELTAVANALVYGADLRADELTEKHADWAEGFKGKYSITAENAMDIVRKETGLVFAKVLEHAGVFARTIEGKVAFLRLLTTV